MNTLQRLQNPLLYVLVFFSGFANLATEIIGPRLFSSMFGTTTSVWAIMISVTLVGLAVGYALGGRISLNNIRTMLPAILLANAVWLMLVSWLVWEVPASAVSGGAAPDTSLILTTAMSAFFVPSVLFGMLSPISITLLGEHRPPEAVSQIVGNIYAISTVGSVAGALAAAFYLIPWVGLSASLRIFAVGLTLFAVYFWYITRDGRQGLPITPALVMGFVLIFPQPDFQWETDDNLTLLAQREGYYQTIRVYSDEETFVQMHLGPSFHSRMDLQTGEPTFSYAETMLDYIGDDLNGADVLIIGGAGHSLARALEAQGANVTEVEIDPFVVELSDEYFGAIEGEVVIADGRIFIDTADPATYDLILIDAFDGAANVPPHLTTREFFEATRKALRTDGRMMYNFIGTPEGERNRSYTAISATLNAAFDYAGASVVTGEISVNIILVASQSPLDDLGVFAIPDDGIVLTDDNNPMEIFLREARDFTYFRR